MATDYDIIDFKWLPDGDFSFGGTQIGSLTHSELTITDDQITGFTELVETWLKYNQGDWRDSPNVGLNLDEFIGKPNSRETANLIREKIYNGLVGAGVIRAGDLSIDIVPIDLHSMMIMLHVKARATLSNSLTEDAVAIAFLYNTSDSSWSTLGIIKDPK